MIERGIIVGGEVQPGTEEVIRDSQFFWTPADSNDVRLRHGMIVDQSVYHWTGGRCHTGPQALERVYKSIEARERGDGSDMAVSIHLIVSWDGLIFQTMDLTHAAIHVGDRSVYRRSVGTEFTWPGTIVQARTLGIDPGEPVVGSARGRRVSCMAPSSEMLDAARRLASMLTSIVHPAIKIPRKLATNYRSPGFLEHRDVPSKLNKIDAAGLLVRALGF